MIARSNTRHPTLTIDSHDYPLEIYCPTPMTLLLQPAIALMQRLRLRPKFALMCLVFLILLLAAALLMNELQKSIATTRQEWLGLSYIARLHALTGLMQQRRALEHLRLSAQQGMNNAQQDDAGAADERRFGSLAR